jgi:hypothetical protein
MIKKDKVFELKIEEDDQVSGIDSISLVDEPAIEINWMYFSKEKEHGFNIPDGEDLKYSEMITQKGQSEEDLLNDGWELHSMEHNGKEEFISSSPNSPSDEDTKDYLIRYKYILNPKAPGAPVKKTTREFCKDLLSKNLVYRVEDLDSIVNDLGSSALVWRGSYNCRHLWSKLTYRRGPKPIENNGSVRTDRVDTGLELDILGYSQPDTRTSNPSFNKEKFESFSDYPESVKNNAKAVLKYVDENGWGSCGTDVGKQRANQLAKGEAISKDTIQRMYSYLSRHAGDLDSSKGYGDGCGKLMYDSWGGKSALSWAESKVKQFNKEKFQDACPPATQDVATNLKNRQNAIDTAHYGPLNPNEPNEDYWIAKAKMFGGDVQSAKKSLCGNCSFFVQTKSMLDCISSGIGGQDAWSTIDAGDLGYCEAFDFKCAASRTCDAWVVGGPITQEFAGEKVSMDYDDTLSTDKGVELAKRLLSEGKDLSIITRRQETDLGPVYKVAEGLGISRNKVHATNGKLKWETIKRLGIQTHYDNNPDEIKAIQDNLQGVRGIKFGYDNNLPSYVEQLPKKKKKNFIDNFEYLISKEDMKKQVFQTDEEKRTIIGPCMVPNLRIPRRDSQGNTYEIFFSPETIKMIAEKYMRNKYLDNNDMMHDGKAINDVYVVESWIKEDMEDKSNKYGYQDTPVGTWFVAMKCAKTPEGDKVWNMVKSGELAGFSVSGWFEEVADFCREEMFLHQVVEILKKY